MDDVCVEEGNAGHQSVNGEAQSMCVESGEGNQYFLKSIGSCELIVLTT